MSKLLPVEEITQKIFIIKGQKVMLSFHLVELYGVENKGIGSGSQKEH